MSEIIAIASEKGGVAKTTTALSLGGALVEAGYEVLLVDLDAQANLTLGVGLRPSAMRRTISDVLLNAATALSASRETDLPGLDIIPANQEMVTAERFLPIRQGYQHILRNALKDLALYDYILLDCPPALGAVTTNALMAARQLVIPTQAEYFSAYALRNMLQLIQRVRREGNPGLDFHILITMLDRRNRIHRTIEKQIRTKFKARVFQTVIQIDTKLRESTVAGLPVTHFAKSSRGAEQYRALAQELVQYVEEAQTIA
ncbi:MAG: ParA family protein [Anaerolineae bacterium]|nr:MAG: ParA family protein [Anaerolineae bacterium]